MSVEVVDGATIMKFVEDEEAFGLSIKDRFMDLDRDKDGLLSHGEMMKELQRLRVFEIHFGEDEKIKEDEVARVYEALFDQFDHDMNGSIDFGEFMEETKKMMVVMANGIGVLPVQMLLEHDSLLKRAVEIESASLFAA